MIDKKKYPQLYKETEETIKRRKEWLQQAIKAQLLCELLPEEIKTLNILSVDYAPNTLALGIVADDGTIPTLKMLGIQGLNPKVSSFSKEEFYTQGEGRLPNDTRLSIHVHGLDKPKGCKVVEKSSTRKEYVLICEGTAEDIK